MDLPLIGVGVSKKRLKKTLIAVILIIKEFSAINSPRVSCLPANVFFMSRQAMKMKAKCTANLGTANIYLTIVSQGE